MSFIPVGFAEAVCEFSIPGDAGPAFIVFGVEPLGGQNTQQTADNIADTMNNSPGIMDKVAPTTVFEQVTVYNKIAPGVTQIASNTTPRAGQGTGSPFPPQVAVLVQKNTGLAGRANRGRMFIPGILEDQVTEDGLLTTAQQAQWQTNMNAFLSDLETNLAKMVLLHTDEALAPTDIASLDVSRKVATQRRRLR